MSLTDKKIIDSAFKKKDKQIAQLKAERELLLEELDRCSTNAMAPTATDWDAVLERIQALVSKIKRN